MDSYRLLFKGSAERELRSVPRPFLKRLLERIHALSENPRPHGSERLAGQERYRIRQGDWRVVYEIDDSTKTVRVYKIGHRREVYR